MNPTADPFRLAVEHHRAGRFEQAAACYRQATARAPGNAGIWCNLGVALKQAGRNNEALEAYRQALKVAPEFAEAHFNLAILLHAVGRYNEAVDAYRRTLAIKPKLPAAQANLGHVLRDWGRSEEAVESYRRALALQPDHLGALVNLGATLNQLERFAEAEDACRRALALEPRSALALGHLSAAIGGQGRHGEAEACARKALDRKPDCVPALTALEAALRGQKRTAEIPAIYQAALRYRPDFAHAHCALAEHHLAEDDAAAALAACEAALQQRPAHVMSLALKVTALAALGAKAEYQALTDPHRLILRRQWDNAPGHADLARFNRALSAHILAHPSLRYEPGANATRLGRHSGELRIEPRGPIAQLEEMICQAVEAYGKAVPADPEHPFLAHPPQAWTLTIWSVVLEGQGFQIPHIHPAGWLSGVYYAALPRVIDRADAAHAGWIEFGRPLLRHQELAAPEVHLVKPEEGLMLLFPSYFLHRTLPFESQETRISIAFDLMPHG